MRDEGGGEENRGKVSLEGEKLLNFQEARYYALFPRRGVFKEKPRGFPGGKRDAER